MSSTIYYDYDRYVQNALKTVVKDVLRQIEKNGVLGKHSLYITFRTEHAGVVVPKQLKEQYPYEITIVLQYQFWDLSVSDKNFEVSLSFSGVIERLVIPYDALVSFVDPFVKFCLQFTVEENLEEEFESEVSSSSEEESEDNKPQQTVVSLSEFRKKNQGATKLPDK